MTASSGSGGALRGTRVIDVTQALAGPYCTMNLADMGADVIKVEPPEGDDTRSWGPPWWGHPSERRSAYFAAVNRNKRSVVLDLRTDGGRAALDRLSSADETQLVLRLGYGMFYPLQCITPFYTQNLFQEPTIYFTQTTVNSAVGVGPLANYVYGVSPLPPGPPADPTEIPRGALISSVPTTSITTSSPALNGSGRITVTTPYGQALSVADFFVPPSPYVASDVLVTVPKGLAKAYAPIFGLSIYETPVAMPGYEMAAVQGPISARDPAVDWLVNNLLPAGRREWGANV